MALCCLFIGARKEWAPHGNSDAATARGVTNASTSARMRIPQPRRCPHKFRPVLAGVTYIWGRYSQMSAKTLAGAHTRYAQKWGGHSYWASEYNSVQPTHLHEGPGHLRQTGACSNSMSRRIAVAMSCTEPSVGVHVLMAVGRVSPKGDASPV